jgi:hypothetical protein
MLFPGGHAIIKMYGWRGRGIGVRAQCREN